MAVKKKGYTPKKRNSNKRRRNSIFLIATEGNNKTEEIYFRNIMKSTNKVKIRFASGIKTNCNEMVRNLLKECKNLELDEKLGDRAYCVVDSDVDKSKDRQLRQADELASNSKKCDVKVIVSNPCFEEWFICHFGYSTKQYSNSNELLKDLKKKIPNYTKSSDIYMMIVDNQEKAINNAIKLEKFNIENGRKIHTADFQPSTEIYKILEDIRNIENI